MQHGAPIIGKLGPLTVHKNVRFSGLTALQTVTQWPGAGCSNRAKHTVDTESERPLRPRRCSQLQCAVMYFIMNCLKIQVLICAGKALRGVGTPGFEALAHRTGRDPASMHSEVYITSENTVFLPFPVCVCS